MSAVGFDSDPLLLGFNVTGPKVDGVIVNVCAAAEPLKLRIIVVLTPPPLGVMAISPV